MSAYIPVCLVEFVSTFRPVNMHNLAALDLTIHEHEFQSVQKGARLSPHSDEYAASKVLHKQPAAIAADIATNVKNLLLICICTIGPDLYSSYRIWTVAVVVVDPKPDLVNLSSTPFDLVPSIAIVRRRSTLAADLGTPGIQIICLPSNRGLGAVGIGQTNALDLPLRRPNFHAADDETVLQWYQYRARRVITIIYELPSI
jgi:hypothetical protein